MKLRGIAGLEGEQQVDKLLHQFGSVFSEVIRSIEDPDYLCDARGLRGSPILAPPKCPTVPEGTIDNERLARAIALNIPALFKRAKEGGRIGVEMELSDVMGQLKIRDLAIAVACGHLPGPLQAGNQVRALNNVIPVLHNHLAKDLRKWWRGITRNWGEEAANPIILAADGTPASVYREDEGDPRVRNYDEMRVASPRGLNTSQIDPEDGVQVALTYLVTRFFSPSQTARYEALITLPGLIRMFARRHLMNELKRSARLDSGKTNRAQRVRTKGIDLASAESDGTPKPPPGALGFLQQKSAEFGQAVERAFAGLTPLQRTISQMYHLDGCRQRDIAVALRRTKPVISQTLWRDSWPRIKRSIENEGGEPARVLAGLELAVRQGIVRGLESRVSDTETSSEGQP